MKSLNLNKVCELEDFANPELASVIRDVFAHETRHFTPAFPEGAEYRKYWEIGMSVLAFQRNHLLRPDAIFLGVGAGTETTLFYLTNHARQVFATDLYLNPGIWGQFAPGFMLYEPEKVAPYPFHRERLVVQHMDGRVLNYPDNSFDGIFSSGSIEHFGNLDYVANSAYEMGRVLKPGGVLTLSTEFCIDGPPDGIGWEGCITFTRQHLIQYIIEASGLELIDELTTEVSDQTLETQRDLSIHLEHTQRYLTQQGHYPRVGEIVWSIYPHLVLLHQGYVFGSVHLALRKPTTYPVTSNGWAKPTEQTIKSVQLLQSGDTVPDKPAFTADFLPGEPLAPAPVIAETIMPPSDIDFFEEQQELRRTLQAWEGVRIRGWYNKTLRRLPAPLAGLGRGAIRLAMLGRTLEAQSLLYQVMIKHQTSLQEHINRLATLSVGLDAQARHNDAQIRAMSGVVIQRAELQAHLAQQQAQLEHMREQQQLLSQQQQLLSQQLSEMMPLEERVAELYEQLSTSSEQRSLLETQLIAHQQVTTQLQQNFTQVTRQHTSQMRFLRQRLQHAQATAEETSTAMITGDEMIGLLMRLDRTYPELQTTQAVELSIQDAHAELALVMGAAYFGVRMSSSSPNYRAPNDAWYHVDFGDSWNDAHLYQGAVARLRSGGWYILLTSAEHAEPHQPESMRQIANELLALPLGKQIRAYIWQRS